MLIQEPKIGGNRIEFREGFKNEMYEGVKNAIRRFGRLWQELEVLDSVRQSFAAEVELIVKQSEENTQHEI